MIRAAIYARFSSDRQNDKSVDDQIVFSREICAREGFAVVSTFEDREISGASIVNRPGFSALMRAAEARLFDVIVAEDMDRLFRNQADYHASRQRLDFLGIGIHISHGAVGFLDGSLHAILGEAYLRNLAVHTRRGLEAVIRDGRHAGGRAYGYTAVPGKPGELVINQAEAAVVRRIFADFIAGKTPRAIAAGLNAERIAPPRGTLWNASTINGNATRGHGLLLNELYAGRIVWNKVRMIKDPSTGKRVSRPNKREAHRSAEAPHLRILDDETFRAAQAIKAQRSHIGAAGSRKPQRPLSGLLRCGSCGAGMSSIGAAREGKSHRIQCSAHRENGSCANGRKVARQAIETMTFAALREALAQPEAVAEYVRAYNAERRRLARTGAADRARAERRMGEIDRELDRLVDAIAKGMAVDKIAARVKALESERDEVRARSADLADAADVITLHPAALDRYARDIAELAALVDRDTGNDPEAVAQLVTALRRLVIEVVVHAPAGSEELTIEIKGRLGELIGADPIVRRERAGGTVGSGRAIHAISPASNPLVFVLFRSRMAA